MDIKHKIYDIRNWKKHLFLGISSVNIDNLVLSLYLYVETRSIEVFWLLSQPLRHLRSISSSSAKYLPPSCETFYAINTYHLKQKIFIYEYPMHWVPLPIKRTPNKTLLFVHKLLKHSRQFDYWNQPLNIYTLVCYLDCHEAGLCCYLVICTENVLRPLQLFYFHLWPIYWLSLIVFFTVDTVVVM
jgi:hypothetical protein